MNKLPTAEEFLLKKGCIKEGEFFDFVSPSDLIEFTKLHVQKALKEAHAQAIHNMDTNAKEFKDSILNAYPLTNIK